MNLGLDLVEGLVKLILDREIIALDLRLAGLGNLGINFLLQFLGRNSPSLGFGFHELLADHVLEGAALELVFLIMELQQLRPDRRLQVLLINRLPCDGCEGLAGAAFGCFLGSAQGRKPQAKRKFHR